MKGKAMMVMVVSGIICAIMLWMSMWAVSGRYEIEAISGGIVGGVLSGLIMYFLTPGPLSDGPYSS
jgi:uncharacterized membrane protein YvlD (DUF360 family)